MADAISVAPTNGDYDRGPEFIRVAWIECSIAIIFVALRFYSRIKYVSKLWWDDWVMLLTLVRFEAEHHHQKLLLIKKK